MENLGVDTLLELLTAYEVAIRELRFTGDPDVLAYVGRLEKRQAEALSAIAAANADAFANARSAVLTAF